MFILINLLLKGYHIDRKVHDIIQVDAESKLAFHVSTKSQQ
jgi:hypothetical protein